MFRETMQMVMVSRLGTVLAASAWDGFVRGEFFLQASAHEAAMEYGTAERVARAGGKSLRLDYRPGNF